MKKDSRITPKERLIIKMYLHDAYSRSESPYKNARGSQIRNTKCITARTTGADNMK